MGSKVLRNSPNTGSHSADKRETHIHTHTRWGGEEKEGEREKQEGDTNREKK